MSTQHIATLLSVTFCVRLAPCRDVLRHVATCCNRVAKRMLRYVALACCDRLGRGCELSDAFRSQVSRLLTSTGSLDNAIREVSLA